MNKLLSHLAIFAAYAIFGINIVTTKDLTNGHLIAPLPLSTLRFIGATALFWALSLACRRVHVPPRDLLRIAAASLLGLIVPQLTFLEAISMTTAIDTSIIGSITPIFTMFIAAIVLKEPLTWQKVLGVALSFGGILWLILNSVTVARGADATSPMGVALLVANTLSFAAYLGVFRPLISRYPVVVFMRWMFLFALLITLPFSAGAVLSAPYSALTPRMWGDLFVLIVFATFVAYFLIPFAQKSLRPTVVSMYTYVQPVLAVLLAVCTGLDTLTLPKAAAMIVVIGGVWIVNKSRAREVKS